MTDLWDMKEESISERLDIPETLDDHIEEAIVVTIVVLHAEERNQILVGLIWLETSAWMLHTHLISHLLGNYHGVTVLMTLLVRSIFMIYVMLTWVWHSLMNSYTYDQSRFYFDSLGSHLHSVSCSTAPHCTKCHYLLIFFFQEQMHLGCFSFSKWFSDYHN